MKKHKLNGKGKSTSLADIEGKEIEFPVTFRLKAVMEGSGMEKVHMDKLESVLTNNDISFSYQSKKASSKGTYTSYTYEVTIESKVQLQNMYEGLRKIKELKFAV